MIISLHGNKPFFFKIFFNYGTEKSCFLSPKKGGKKQHFRRWGVYLLGKKGKRLNFTFLIFFGFFLFNSSHLDSAYKVGCISRWKNACVIQACVQRKCLSHHNQTIGATRLKSGGK